MRIRWSASLLSIALAAWPVFAQPEQCKVLIPITVRAESGDAPATLNSSNFTVRLGDLKVASEVVAPAKPMPPRVAILLDTSGSMRTKWEFAKSLATSITQLLEPADDLALIAFSDSVTGRVPLTKDREAIARVVHDATPPAGRTAMLDAIVSSISEVPLRRGDAVVVITDGGDNRSRFRESKLRDLIVASGVRVFSIGIYDANFATPEEINGPTLLTELRDLTAGEIMEVTPADLHFIGKPPKVDEKSTARVVKELTRITTAIDHPLLLRVTWPFPAGGTKPPKLKVEVVDEYGRRIRNLIVRYPQRIVGCAAEAQAQAPLPAKPN